MPEELSHPSADDFDIGAIFAALADPLRRQVVLTLAQNPEEIRDCSSFALPVTKATRTHHFRVLRDAGLIRQVDHGNGRTNQLRLAELKKRFPGLADLLLAEAAETVI